MSWSHFLHLILGLCVGLMPTLYRLLMRKLEKLEADDPVAQAIIEEAMRKQNAKFTDFNPASKDGDPKV
jgi:hypothetical protein